MFPEVAPDSQTLNELTNTAALLNTHSTQINNQLLQTFGLFQSSQHTIKARTSVQTHFIIHLNGNTIQLHANASNVRPINCYHIIASLDLFPLKSKMDDNSSVIQKKNKDSLWMCPCNTTQHKYILLLFLIFINQVLTDSKLVFLSCAYDFH